MAKQEFESFTGKLDAPTEFEPFDGTLDGEPAKPSGALRRGIADKALGFASGAVGATKALADVAGAGNVVSNTLDAANKGINDYLSPEAKADQQEQAALMDSAKGQGTWEGVKAGAKAFAVAPVQTAVQGLGSIVPILAGTALTGGAAPAAAVGAGIGSAMGAGTAKGAIYDEIKKRGGTEEEATKAQEYGGANTDQIALGGALGTADALTGVSKMAGNMVRGALKKPVTELATQTVGKAAERGVFGRAGMGMLSEMPLEAAQGGQEQVAANLAAQRAGYEAGTWDNVASNATLESLASAGPGAAFGAVNTPNATVQPPPKQPPAVPPVQPGSPPQDPAQLGYDPMAGTHTVFPDGSVVLNSESSNGSKTVRDMQRANRLANVGQDVTDVEPILPATPQQQTAAAILAAAPIGPNGAPNPGPISRAGLAALDSSEIQLNQASEADQAAYDAHMAEQGNKGDIVEQRIQQYHEETAALLAQQARENYDNAIVESLDAQDEYPGETIQALNQLDDADIPDIFATHGNSSDEDFLRAMGATDQEIADAITSQPSSPQASVTSLASSTQDDATGKGTGAGNAQTAGLSNAATDGVQPLPATSSGQDGNQPTGSVESGATDGNGVGADTGGREADPVVQFGELPTEVPVNAVNRPTTAQRKANLARLKEKMMAGRKPKSNPVEAPAAGNASTTDNVPGAGSAKVEGDGIEPKAKWLKAINDQNRLAGDTGVQLTVQNGKLTFLGSPDSTKQGKALQATLAEAQKAGATVAEIIASIQASKKPAPGPASLGSAKADMDHLFGIDQKREKAIARIAKGTAYFGNALKAGEFLAKNGLRETHKAVKTDRGFDIVANEIIKESSTTKPERENRIASILSNGGHVVGSDLRDRNGMRLMGLTPEELATIPADKVRAKPTIQTEITKDIPQPQEQTSEPETSQTIPPVPQQQEAGNQAPTGAAAPAANTGAAGGRGVQATGVKPKKPSLRQRIEDGRKARADYFTPGNIVQGYSGYERVISYKAPDDKGEGWNVTVQAVVKQDGEWVVDPEDTRIRTHSTHPEAKALKDGPVERVAMKSADDVRNMQTANAPAKPEIVVDKAEMRPYRKPDGSVGYEAVPIVEDKQEAEKPGTVNVPPTVAEAFTAQMQKQKGRITRLKNEAEKAGSLDDKKVAQVKVAEAEAKLRTMRMRIFDAEDAAIKAVKSGEPSAFDAFADTFPDAKQEIAKLTGQNDELDAEMQSYEAKKNPTYSGAKSSSPAIQDFIDGKRDSVPSIEEVNAEQKQPPLLVDTAPVATESVAKADAKAALSEREKAAKAKMFNALGKLAHLAGKNTRMNWTAEEEQQLLPIVIELFDGAVELGAVTFQKAVAYVRDFISANLDKETADSIPFETLQGAYIAMSGRHKDKAITPRKEVVAFDSLAELEKSAPQADTPAKDQANEPTNTGSENPQALGDMAPEQDGGTESKRRVGRGRKGRSAGGVSDDSGLTEPRVSGTRSGGSGSTSVRAPKPGGTGRGRRTGAGTEGNGSQLPAERGTAPDSGLSNTPAAEPVSVSNIQATNFRITPDLRLGQGGESEKFRDNLAAIRTLKAIEAEGRRATSEEQRILARYVGWGGLANAFPSPETKEWKDDWKARGAELKDLLTGKEYDLARRSTLDSHYTSQTVVSAMWDAAKRLGFSGGMAAETSMGIGNFMGLMPEGMAGNTRFVGVEYDSLTARMAALLYPQATVLHSGLQKVPLPDSVFDLNIGNPPFGDQSLRFQFKPEFNRVSIHNQFFLAGIDSLKPGGLQLNVVSRYLLDAMDKTTRTMLAKKAKLVAAIRLPDTAFKENARTSVVTDIVMLQRLTPGEQAEMEAAFQAAASKPEKDREKEAERRALAALVPEWVEVTKMRDPLGGDPMTVNSYFAKNPGMILGTLERSGKMQFKNDITVRPSDRDLSEMLAEAVAKLPEGIANTSQDAVAASLERYTSLSDALKIALSGQEAGSIAFNQDGQMEQVYERETPEGDYELTKRVLTESSPWSESLYQDSKGNWFSIEAKLDEDGNKIKVMKDGKPTKANVYDRKMYASESEIPAGMRLGEKRLARLQKMVKLRDLMVNQINLETEDAPPIRMEGNRQKLAKAYREFVESDGFISRQVNSALVANMPDGALVQALELAYRKEITKKQADKLGESPRPEQADPAPILSERVIPKYEPPTKAASAADALSITMSESGRVDIERIASLLGKSEEEVIAEMFDKADKPLIFKDPETQQWVTRNDYLTGQVKKKLHAAQAAGLEKHVRELEAVQPEPWGAENVTVLLGSTFVPPQVYADFIQHVTGMPAKVSFQQSTNSYAVQANGATQEKQDEWGAEGVSIGSMVSDMLNSTSIKVMTKDADGNTVLDKERTELAQLKARQIASEFTDWAFANGDRRKLLVDLFNEKYNTRVTRQHDGSHLTLPGKVPDAILRMRRHQKNAIWRGISERFMLIDHAVGAGKTFTAIARAMERRRMGLSRKPAIVVPNHMVEQFTSDVYRLYPGAKVLAAGGKDFEKKKRRKLFAKIASGDWDIVIIPHSSFGFIGIAPETEERYLEKELALAEQAIKDAWEESEQAESSFRKPFNVKTAERLRDKITARMDSVRGNMNKDRLLTFEQMGIDDLTVDEAHEFKNLFYSTRLKDVKGMGNQSGSQKAFDLYNKVRVLRESPTGTVTFMTGTPISNSAVEMFTMMRYLAADELNELGLEHFDAWRAQFVSADPGWEPTETGRLKEVTRLGRSWSNMRSLMDLYYSFTDSVSNDDIKKAYAEDNNGAKFPIPSVKGGDRRSVVIQPTDDQAKLLTDTMAAFDSLPDIDDPYERNKERLRLMDRARKISLDVRAAVAGHPGKEKGGKLDKIAEEVKRIYTKFDADKGTQLIFLDRSVPKSKGDDKEIKEYDELIAKRNKALLEDNEAELRRVSESLERFDPNEIAELRAAQAGGWNAYQQIKDNLIAQGIPAKEIRFVQDATNDAQKQALFDAVNAGEVRVLIGSTPRMGAGTNVQQRLVGLHHADVTWKPSDIEQREGRIIRQGNKLLDKYGIDNFEVEILAYATERTIDSKMWSLNSAKLKTINAIRNYDGSFSMDFDDNDSVSMAEMAALASGNPLLLERVKLDSDINNLELLRKQHQRKTWGYVSRLEDAEKAIERATPDSERFTKLADQATIGAAELAEDMAARSVTVESEAFTSYAEAAKAVTAEIVKQQAGDDKAKFSVKVGERRLTSQNGALDALSDALGDADPFLATVNGATYRGRTALAREVARLATDAAPSLTAGDSKVLATGKMLGFTFESSLSRSQYGGDYMVDMALVDADGKTVDAVTGRGQADTKFVTSSLTNPLGKLSDSINPERFKSRARGAVQDAERAKRELPELREKAALPFAKEGDLDEKRARLSQVIAELSTDKAPAAPEAEPEGETPAMSRARPVFSRGAQVQANESVETIAMAIASKWEGSPEIVVAFDMDDPIIPANVRKEDQRQRSGGATGTPEGFYYKGTVYLMSSKLGTPDDIARVLFHEALGHYGLRGLFGKALKPVLNEISMRRRAEVDAKIKQYGLKMGNKLDRFTAAEEVLAELAQTRPEIGIVQRAIAAIRTWLRQNVPGFNNMRLSDAEIIRSYILPARAYVENSARGIDAGRVEPTFSRIDQTETSNFKKWFGASAVVDGDGKPLVVYHGTEGEVNVFEPYWKQLEREARPHELQGNGSIAQLYKAAKQEPEMHFFAAERGTAESYGQDVVGVYLQIKNMVGSAEMDRDEALQLMLDSDADGAMFSDTTSSGRFGGVAYVIRKSNQAKSANGNNGDFDGTNPDIRFSRSIGGTLTSAANSARDVNLPAGYKVGDLFNSVPGKLNWWHKTVGTQYNLAQRSPAFKRVYDAVQTFINDVSYFATEAADLAPNILPKLESWKDITKSPLSAADTKALSTPVFEGTLNWARDESGKPVKMAVLEEAAAKLTTEQKAQRLLRGDHISQNVLKMWQGLPIDQFESLIEGKYESSMLKAGIVFTPAELKSLFGLNDKQVSLYQEFRKATDKSLTNLAIADMLRFGGKDVDPIREQVLESKTVGEAAEMLRDYLLSVADDNGVLIDTANKMIDKGDKAQDLMDRGYAPLSRFGTYTLDVVDANGERAYFGMFESAAEASKMRRKMEGLYPGSEITQGTVSEEAYKMFAGVSPETLELFGDMLGLESQGDSAASQAFQEYLKLAKSSRSAMKRLIQRKGIAGFSEDAGRVLAGFVYSNARQTASSLHMGEMTNAANEIDKTQGELKDAAVKLVDYIKNPREEAQALRGLLFAQYIGGSVASAMVNMTQPFTMTFPWLSQYGGASSAAKQMTAAMKDQGKKLTGDAKLDAALRRAEEDGTVSPQEVHQLMQQSQGKGALQSGDGTVSGDAMAKANNALSKVSLAWGKLFGVAEQFNRRVTFIAAYRTAIAQGITNPDAFARKAIAETQGVYNKGNKPAWARGAVGATLFTFKQYSIAYVEMLSRMAKNGPEGKKAALLALGVLFLMSGAGGMPGADDLDDLISGAMQSMGYNFDSKMKRKEFFVSILGEGGAQFMERGISGLPGVPIDVSGRIGLGNLVPGTGLFTKKADHTRDVTEIAGPAGDFVKRGVDAAGSLITGNVGKAVNSISPKAMQNLVQAADMANMGMYRDAKGMKVLDTDGYDAIAKAIGFQPNDVKKAQEANFEAKRMIDLNKINESEIANQWAMGIFEKDSDKVKDARDRLAEWNEANPESPIRINFRQIAQRVNKMKESKAERIAKTAPAEIRNAVRRELATQ